MGHSWKDVHFVSLKVNEKDYYVNVKDFSLMSAKYEYSNSFGCVWVPFSLKIVGEDWWLERNECRFSVRESVSLKQAIG